MDAELTLAPSGRQAASCRRLRGHGGQPPGIGEVLAGILLGPSLLGRIAADVSAYILPPSVAPFLGVIAQIGVILYMFLVGLELNADLLRDRAHAIVAISHASIVAPFVLGSWLALYLYPRLSSSDVPFTSPTPNAQRQDRTAGFRVMTSRAYFVTTTCKSAGCNRRSTR